MTAPDERLALIEAFLQGDAPGTPADRRAFLKALKEAAGAGQDVSPWAGRAASPLADYSFLMALHPYLHPRRGNAPLRLAILGGQTTTQLRLLIEVFLAAEGLEAELFEGGYGLFRQELLTDGSDLDAFGPQIIFLATSGRDVARFPALHQDEAEVARLADEECEAWGGLWARAKRKWNATVIQNDFDPAPGSLLGHFALRHPAARENYLERLNRLFAQRAPAWVVLHDLRGLAAEVGARAWYDPRMHFEFKLPCGAEGLPVYAHSVAALVRALQGRSRKVLVLDLDNTLWGGVVGDLGPGGITLGEGSGEGEAFLAFQRYVKGLRERGIVLAVCSKNDEAKALEPFEQRRDMVLERADFACFIANWENKADNLRTIARRLNLKPEALVFVDDHPAERALVRRLAPEVAVPSLPEDPAGYVGALAAHRYFETVALTAEDTARAQYYADNAKRDLAAGQATDLGCFLASLHMVSRVAPITELTLERAAQLINKSNQFNLTTRRYPVAQVRAMMGSPDWRTLTFTLRDTLGDNGLISVVLARREGTVLEVDTWLMSCRVLQRGVEAFVRDELVALARGEGLDRIVGSYVPSGRNALVENLYPELGFRRLDANRWSLDLTEDPKPLSHHIEREARHE